MLLLVLATVVLGFCSAVSTPITTPQPLLDKLNAKLGAGQTLITVTALNEGGCFTFNKNNYQEYAIAYATLLSALDPAVDDLCIQVGVEMPLPDIKVTTILNVNGSTGHARPSPFQGFIRNGELFTSAPADITCLCVQPTATLKVANSSLATLVSAYKYKVPVDWNVFQKVNKSNPPRIQQVSTGDEWFLSSDPWCLQARPVDTAKNTGVYLHGSVDRPMVSTDADRAAVAYLMTETGRNPKVLNPLYAVTAGSKGAAHDSQLQAIDVVGAERMLSDSATGDAAPFWMNKQTPGNSPDEFAWLCMRKSPEDESMPQTTSSTTVEPSCDDCCSCDQLLAWRIVAYVCIAVIVAMLVAGLFAYCMW